MAGGRGPWGAGREERCRGISPTPFRLCIAALASVVSEGGPPGSETSSSSSPGPVQLLQHAMEAPGDAHGGHTYWARSLLVLTVTGVPRREPWRP